LGRGHRAPVDFLQNFLGAAGQQSIRHRRGQLFGAGALVNVVEAYETVAPESSRGLLRSALQDGHHRPDVITFTSSSTVRNFVSLLELTTKRGGPRPALLEGIKLAAIGPVTSETLREAGLPVDIEAREYTIPGLVQVIVAALA